MVKNQQNQDHREVAVPVRAAVIPAPIVTDPGKLCKLVLNALKHV